MKHFDAQQQHSKASLFAALSHNFTNSLGLLPFQHVMQQDVVAEHVGTEPLGRLVRVLVLECVLLLRQFVELIQWISMTRRHHEDTCRNQSRKRGTRRAQ